MAADRAAFRHLLDAAINQREVFIEQLQLFTTGAQRHPTLVDKGGASVLLRAARASVDEAVALTVPLFAPARAHLSDSAHRARLSAATNGRHHC